MENQVPRRSVGREPLDDEQEYKNNESHSAGNASRPRQKPPRDKQIPTGLTIGVLFQKRTKSFDWIKELPYRIANNYFFSVWRK